MVMPTRSYLMLCKVPWNTQPRSARVTGKYGAVIPMMPKMRIWTCLFRRLQTYTSTEASGLARKGIESHGLIASSAVQATRSSQANSALRARPYVFSSSI